MTDDREFDLHEKLLISLPVTVVRKSLEPDEFGQTVAEPDKTYTEYVVEFPDGYALREVKFPISEEKLNRVLKEKLSDEPAGSS